MTNFDFLKSTPEFESFASVAISAEKILHIDLEACVLNCRRSMEFAIKWIYSVDRELYYPENKQLINLLNTSSFRELVGDDLWHRLDFIRRLGNVSAHGGNEITYEQAGLCLENLFIFLDFVAYTYAPEYTENEFDESLLELTVDEALSFVPKAKEKLDEIVKENRSLKEELMSRQNDRSNYIPKTHFDSERKTRRTYIELMLKDAGWTRGDDWQTNVDLSDGEGSYLTIDHVLSDHGKPLAILDHKHTMKSFDEGKKHATLCADILESKFGLRPVIFLSNGFMTVISDNDGNEITETVYTKSELKRLIGDDVKKDDSVVEVVAALIWENGKFLICQRPAHKTRGLLWEFVGGKVEPGETMRQALIRECEEELGVIISAQDIFTEVTHSYPDITVHLTLFNSRIESGTPKLLEHNDIKWIYPREIPKFDFCPADKDILEKIAKRRT